MVDQAITSTEWVSKYLGKTSFFPDGESPLKESIGYLVVLGFGAAFSLFTTLLVFIENKSSGSSGMTSEKFK